MIKKYLLLFLAFLSLNAFSQTYIAKYKVNSGLTIHADENDYIDEIYQYYRSYCVDWGDGNIDCELHSNITHYYSNSGIYTVTISGYFPYPEINAIFPENAHQLIEIVQWENGWKIPLFSWKYAGNLERVPPYPPIGTTTSLSGMFTGKPNFKGGLASWDVKNITDMKGIFSGASNYNEDISKWDVSNVTDMEDMFSGASSFNADISEWNVSKVTNMKGMFSNASSFNRDISKWDISKVTNMEDMLSGTSLSTENYDALLKAWSKLELVRDVTLDAKGIQYCSSEEERQYIIDHFGWTINDSGKADGCSSLDEESLTFSEGLSLYPNPTSETVFLTTETPLVKVEIYSVQGTLIKELKSNLNAIPVGELDNGVYILRIYSDEGVAVEEFVKN